MTDVLLATCAALPDGEPGGAQLLADLRGRGLEARWAVWDDPAVDWSTAGLVAVRSTWDYEERLDDFLTWADGVGPGMLNGAPVFAWNTDKRYLVDLAESGVPVVPTVAVDEARKLMPTVAEHFPAVVKPRVGAGGRGVVLFGASAGDSGGLDSSRLGRGPWIVQPLVTSVRTEGETSVFVLGGEVVSQARKLPAPGEIRVHESYGGRSEATSVTAEAAEVASASVAAAGRLLDVDLAYARVDLMRGEDGVLMVSEIEATEPGLYLDLLPDNAAAFGDLVERELSGLRVAGTATGEAHARGKRPGQRLRAAPARTPSHPRGEPRLGPGESGGQ